MSFSKPRAAFFAFAFFCLFFLSPSFARADFIGQRQVFSVDASYDSQKRGEVPALLITANSRAYFYVEEEWWNQLDLEKQQISRDGLNQLAEEFETKIYPTLTATFGPEWKPGIDGDDKITIFFHTLASEAGGYFSTGNEYPKAQVPASNEREMIFLNTRGISTPILKSFLAHEFLHLITFYQKDKIQNVQEEIWLNEARAEYAPTLLGYDLVFDGSNLKNRVRNFIDKTFDSLTEWQNKPADYGVLNLFTQYLVDYYGVSILVDSLRSKKNGIASLNEALAKNGFPQDFAQIFGDWVTAIFLNDCSIGPRYCYRNPNLKEVRVVPQTNFLPTLGESTLSLVNTAKDWAGSWYRIIGGKDVLKVEFQGNSGVSFKVPYLLEDKDGRFSVYQLALDASQKGAVYVPSFSKDNKAIILMPLVITRTAGLDDAPYPVYRFSLVISTVLRDPAEEAALRAKLLAQIEEIKKEIARLQALLLAKLANPGLICGRFEVNLVPGTQNSNEVRCLQKFLKAQGQEIYPEGLVTGNFLEKTRQAVVRFQEKYADKILAPAGLIQGTGFVGSLTRAKINQLLAGF